MSHYVQLAVVTALNTCDTYMTTSSKAIAEAVHNSWQRPASARDQSSRSSRDVL